MTLLLRAYNKETGLVETKPFISQPFYVNELLADSSLRWELACFQVDKNGLDVFERDFVVDRKSEQAFVVVFSRERSQFLLRHVFDKSKPKTKSTMSPRRIEDVTEMEVVGNIHDTKVFQLIQLI